MARALRESINTASKSTPAHRWIPLSEENEDAEEDLDEDEGWEDDGDEAS